MQFAMNWSSNTVLKLDTESLDRWALLLKLLVAGEPKQYFSDSLNPQRVVELANYVRLLFETVASYMPLPSATT